MTQVIEDILEILRTYIDLIINRVGYPDSLLCKVLGGCSACTKRLFDKFYLRDMKKYTSKQIISGIQENPKESRKEWMIWMFERAGKRNSNNENYQFWQQDNHSY